MTNASESIDLDELERLARKQADGYARMLELNGGIGLLGVRHPEMFEDMLTWAEVTGNEHADTVLALIERVREAERVAEVRNDTIAIYERVTAERDELAEKHRRAEKFLRMERVAAREQLVRAEEAEAGWHALTIVVERVKSVLVHPNRIEEHGEASLRWSIRKAFDILHECTSVVRNPGKSEVEQERDELAAVVEQMRQWRHDWFNEPIEGVKRKPHHRRLDDVLDAAPSVALDRVRAEALREAADGFRLYGDRGDQAVAMVTVENYLNDRADRIEKGKRNARNAG